MEGKTGIAAAAAAGMSERTARTWKDGQLPSATKSPRWWRTRPDPFSELWESEVVPLLEKDEEGILEARTILEVLETSRPGRYGESQLRTLQRRVRQWRALYGPAKEAFFPQGPGRECAFDFTHATDLGVIVQGEVLEHLLFECVLSFSGWTYARLAFSETYEALSCGLQEALWAFGGCPEVARSDNLSAATHELRSERGRTWDEERPRLLSLPVHPFPTDLVRPVPRARSLYVPFDLNHYSIAPEAVGRVLSLVASDTVVRILDGSVEISRHRRSFDRGQYVDDPGHEEKLLESKGKARGSSPSGGS